VKIIPRRAKDESVSGTNQELINRQLETRAAREAAILSLFAHPWICGIQDVVRTDDDLYLLLDYTNGVTLLDYIITHGRLKEKQARKFARQIGSALDYCHRNNVVHRDICIENIMVDEMENIKIIDFNHAELFSHSHKLRASPPPFVVPSRYIYFTAPEVVQILPQFMRYVGPEVDIWSFGVVLYILTCGKVPFDDNSPVLLNEKIMKGDVEYPPWVSTGQYWNLL
jgi:serine/threonine protein kinase